MLGLGALLTNGRSIACAQCNLIYKASLSEPCLLPGWMSNQLRIRASNRYVCQLCYRSIGVSLTELNQVEPAVQEDINIWFLISDNLCYQMVCRVVRFFSLFGVLLPKVRSGMESTCSLFQMRKCGNFGTKAAELDQQLRGLEWKGYRAASSTLD